MGVRKTIARVVERYFWPKMGRYIERYVRQCVVCCTSKSRNGIGHQGLMSKYKFANAAFQMISMDFVGKDGFAKHGYPGCNRLVH